MEAREEEESRFQKCANPMTEKVRIEVSTDVKMEVWHRMRQTLD
jgi:hypothetical protein